jgi:hypothetical protein
VDVPGLVSVYVALHSLPSNPDLSRSVAITTSILVQTSPDLAKQFIEELSGNGVDPGEHAYHTLLHSYATPDTVKEFHAMMKCLQSRGMVLRPSIHKQMLELAADMGDPVRAGQAVSAIRRSGQRLSATAFSRYIVANAKSRVFFFIIFFIQILPSTFFTQCENVKFLAKKVQSHVGFNINSSSCNNKNECDGDRELFFVRVCRG